MRGMVGIRSSHAGHTGHMGHVNHIRISHMAYMTCMTFMTVILLSCSPKYRAYSKQYNFITQDSVPQYSNPDYWASHPDKRDLGDSISNDLKKEPRDSIADVFFIYPTTYTTKEKRGWNADINDSELNAKTDYTSILYPATVFNQHARLFAPRYRQAHLSAFYIKKNESRAAFDTAYADVKKAFLYYLKNHNSKRPIIIAGHSQGGLLAEWLLKEFFDNKPLQKQLVAAYVLGWPVAGNYFTSLKPCANAEQTECFCSWRTYRIDFTPEYITKENPQSVVTNPLNWKIDSSYAPKELNKGSILKNFNKLVPKTTDAQIHNGLLWVHKPKFRGSAFFRTKNYHIADVNLFYKNIRENVETRIRAFTR